MTGFVSLVAFVALGIFTSYCSGQCGFPGQPKNGRVVLQLDPRSLNEIHSENSSLSATYSCDENHLLLPPGSRQCIGGRWDGEIPQCLEIKWISEFYESNVYLRALRSGCQYIDPRYSYRFEIEKERRLHSIRVKAVAKDWNSFENAALTIEGRKNDQSKWENLVVTRTNLVPHSSSSFVLTGYFKNYPFKNFLLTSNNWSFYICEIVLLVYHDECGHPEVPLNGRVQWKPDDTKATYRCDDDYQLVSNYSTRHCIQGQWNGSQPICEPVTAETTNREMTNKSQTNILIGTCSVLFIIVVIFLVILYKKTRLSCLVKRSRRDDDANYYATLEEAQRVVDSARQVDSQNVEHEANGLDVAEESESAEIIRLNRQSRREWMEHHSHNYAELAGFADGSASSRPEDQPTLIYANLQETSRGVPIYAQIDKSKKTNRK